MTFTVIDPRGREETVLSVPRYDFNWQFAYELESPLRIRRGSMIKAVAHYDNSVQNRSNPDPSQDVIWGQQASNEMFNPFIEIVYDNRALRDVAPLQRDCGLGQPPGGFGGISGFPSQCP